ncbi:polyhydroxyalkanoic acid synthase, partial [Xanthomonas oryzae pv. oryzae]
GSGVDGAIALLPQQVHVTAELGFLLSAMQPMVESEIRRLLAEKLA